MRVTPTEPIADAASPVDVAAHPIPLRRWVMAVAILVLNLADVVITKAILRLGGTEANPIMAPIMDHPAYPIVLKTVIALGVGGLLLASPPQSKLSDRAVGTVILAYTAVLVWNVGILLQSGV